MMCQEDRVVVNNPVPALKIERHMPVLPMSREVSRIEELKRGMVLYRMVFGQPRQEDLMNFLQETVEDKKMEEMLDFKIDLEPK